MTKKEILKKVIKKIIENGFQGFPFELKSKVEKINFIKYLDISIPEEAPDSFQIIENNIYVIYEKNIIEFLFSHDFAKAYWGDNIPITEIGLKGKIVGYDIPKDNQIKYWQLRLQQMVLKEDKFKYLEKFL